MKDFGGEVIFLDRADINTDEIIPARYLTEVKKEALKPYLLEDLEVEGFDPKGEKLQRARIVVSRKNFGCGSSREHAPWAFEVNDINIVIAESFARIFRQNMFNCGMMAIEMPKEKIDELFALSQKGAVLAEVDFAGKKIVFKVAGEEVVEAFELTEFDAALVEAEGWVGYADSKY